MLDDVTKKRINTLRQILVGKLPDPKAQVEQITNGLIYKFMNDMDEQSVSMGGKSTYFSGKFQKYSWKNLLDTKTSGVEKIKLFSEAIEQMYTNENLPELFREIFKNSFLPFKDPSTLNMFLKEINEFHYSNSEKLGDAFEYLLSFIGSQGDAGQFRTPRHIIDFITEIVNPQKNETILDPACGTAGFLISAYKHILKQNTKKNLGDNLSAPDRKKIGENLNGYDISPDMVKMSLVNMYLHKFTNPKINEYDTLSSEDRWNEYYDVILANPPFFSPTGGIMPHNRFGVKSTKSEVLFIDYINEHLKPNGRAGIIVPEGIIERIGKNYRQLRKRLIETSLLGVISLPAGVFNPYSGVKTSILVLDKSKKENKNIFFVNVDNDGFNLGKKRKPIEKSDLNEITEIFLKYINDKKIDKKYLITKNIILQNEDYSLSSKKYIIDNTLDNFKYQIKPLGEICDVRDGTHDSPKYTEKGYPLITSKNVINGSISFENVNLISQKDYDEINKRSKVEKGDLLMPMIGTIGRPTIVESEKKFAIKNVALIKSKNIVSQKYIKLILDSKIFENYLKSNQAGSTQNFISLGAIRNFKIPILPPKKQKEILRNLDDIKKNINKNKKDIEKLENEIEKKVNSFWFN